MGFIPQQCLLVRERSDAPYRYFFDPIFGFTYVPGYQYLLRVGVQPRVNPPQDVSSLEYRLIKVLSKIPAAP